MSERGESRRDVHEVNEVRDVLVLSRGARLGLLLAALLAVVAAVLWWLPVERLAPPAPPVPCGTAAAPVTAPAAVQLCGALAQRKRVEATGFAAAALVLAGGSVLVFGADRRRQVARPQGAAEGQDEASASS